jgi:protein phosphatase 1 regulatory subunit 7
LIASSYFCVTQNLEALTNLTELWLGKNKITEIQGLDTLSSLVRISIQSNRLTSIGTGLSKLHKLEELYLSHQAITEISGLESLVKLNTIDMIHNRLTTLEGLPVEALPELEELWVSENQIATFEQVACLDKAKALKTVYLEHNPLEKEFEYRLKLAAMVPTLTKIDATRCR